jgi:indole-3-glycerol phosphate synthase
MSFLNRILDRKREEVAEKKRRADTVLLWERVQEARRPVSLKEALSTEGFAVIAEIKKASPSAGVIREDFDPADHARSYERSGARAISVLTDESFFHGSLEDLRQVREATALAVLRKDFVIDRFQLFEARGAGADAVLLIAAALPQTLLHDLHAEAQSLGMEALVEVHTEEELRVVEDIGVSLVGINNRDLQTFHTDLSTTLRLRPLVPPHAVVVSESGIRTAEDVRVLTRHGVHAVLVGEHFMRAADPGAALRTLLQEVSSG